MPRGSGSRPSLAACGTRCAKQYNLRTFRLDSATVTHQRATRGLVHLPDRSVTGGEITVQGSVLACAGLHLDETSWEE